MFIARVFPLFEYTILYLSIRIWVSICVVFRLGSLWIVLWSFVLTSMHFCWEYAWGPICWAIGYVNERLLKVLPNNFPKRLCQLSISQVAGELLLFCIPARGIDSFFFFNLAFCAGSIVILMLTLPWQLQRLNTFSHTGSLFGYPLLLSACSKAFWAFFFIGLYVLSLISLVVLYIQSFLYSMACLFAVGIQIL